MSCCPDLCNDNVAGGDSEHTTSTQIVVESVIWIALKGGKRTFMCGFSQIGRLCFVVDEFQRTAGAEIYIAIDQTMDMVTTVDGRLEQLHKFSTLPHLYKTSGHDVNRRHHRVDQIRRSSDYTANMLCRGLQENVSSLKTDRHGNIMGRHPATKGRPDDGNR